MVWLIATICAALTFAVLLLIADDYEEDDDGV